MHKNCPNGFSIKKVLILGKSFKPAPNHPPAVPSQKQRLQPKEGHLTDTQSSACLSHLLRPNVNISFHARTRTLQLHQKSSNVISTATQQPVLHGQVEVCILPTQVEALFSKQRFEQRGYSTPLPTFFWGATWIGCYRGMKSFIIGTTE